ncbi:MAG: hypothetical protein ABIJ09_00195 [Pseudomonadota bacterium]
MPRFLVAVGLALLLVACPDPGLDVDAGTGPTLVLLEAPSPARGPLRVHLIVETTRALSLGLDVDSGSGSGPATLFEAASDLPTPDPSAGRIEVTLIWDSVSDVDGDAPVQLRARWSAGGDSGVLEPATTVQVNNDPDTTRWVLAPHPSGMLPSGGSSNVNDQVSVLTLDAHGGIADTGTDLTVGTGPSKALFTPDGTLAFTLNGRDSTVTVLDVTASGITRRTGALDLSPYSFYDLAVAPDGTSLFVVAGTGPENALFEYDLSSGTPVEMRSLDLGSVAQCLAVFPRGDLIAVGRGSPNGRWFEIYDRRDLSLVGAVEYDALLCSGLRVSLDAHWAVSADQLGSTQVALFDVSDATAPTVVATVSNLTAVVEGIFHPDSSALAVSTLNGNSVVPYAISSSGQLSAGSKVSGGLSLAAEMDIVTRGSQRGLIAVSALTAVVMVQLDAAGTAYKRGTVDLGSGIENSVEGLAISP